MFQERLNSLILLTTEQELAINLILEEIIENLKNSTKHRIVLR